MNHKPQVEPFQFGFEFEQMFEQGVVGILLKLAQDHTSASKKKKPSGEAEPEVDGCSYFEYGQVVPVHSRVSYGRCSGEC
jgi:hypothetical protein